MNTAEHIKILESRAMSFKKMANDLFNEVSQIKYQENKKIIDELTKNPITMSETFTKHKNKEAGYDILHTILDMATDKPKLLRIQQFGSLLMVNGLELRNVDDIKDLCDSIESSIPHDYQYIGYTPNLNSLPECIMQKEEGKWVVINSIFMNSGEKDDNTFDTLFDALIYLQKKHSLLV